MIKVGVVGLGKMGLSHLAMINAHPSVEVVGVCDLTGYVLDVLHKYTGLETYSDYTAMLDSADLDAVIIATSTKAHAPMIEAAFARGVHVFSEKPLCLDARDSQRLADVAAKRQLVTQVGYHNRFVGAFAEVKRLLELGAIGRVTHVLAEAYGPVVLAPKGGTWRSRRAEGGGCLYDYAAHPIDLLNWYLGAPVGVGGTVLGRVFSKETEDEVAATLYSADGASAQLSVSWSDESMRKMGTKITLWGTAGRIFVDRQEIQVYLRDTADIPEGYEAGWNVRYTTELTEPVWFYLRGEEYSAQLADFVRRVESGRTQGVSTFSTALVADQVIEMLLRDSEKGPRTTLASSTAEPTAQRRPGGRPQRWTRTRAWWQQRKARRKRRRKPAPALPGQRAALQAAQRPAHTTNAATTATSAGAADTAPTPTRSN